MITQYYAVLYECTIPAPPKSKLPARVYWKRHCECDFVEEAQEVVRDILTGHRCRIVKVTEEEIQKEAG